METLVWSERVEIKPGLRDCTYSSALMILVYGGFTKFPLGLYSWKERQALERSDDQPDETGASQIDITVACKRRYGVSLHTVDETLARALTIVGRAYSLAGVNGRLPKGHTLRRWDPNFSGPHCVCVIPLGGGRSLWLDPLAPNKYKGDIVNNSTILTWAYGGKSNMRMIEEDEFLPKPVPGGADVVPILDATPRKGDLKAGVQMYSLDRKPIVKATVDVTDKYFPFRSDTVYSGMFRDSTDELVLVKTADITDLRPYADPTLDAKLKVAEANLAKSKTDLAACNLKVANAKTALA